MTRRLIQILSPLALLATGCASTEPLERRIEVLSFQLDSANQAAEQAVIKQKLAERDAGLLDKDVRRCKEELALVYDSLREANAKLDTGLQDRLTELSESTPGEALPISQYGGVILESSVLFAPGKHDLTPAGKAALKPLVDTLSQPTYASYDIELAGHTDTDPIKHTKERYRDNWDLASMRANSVRRFLNESGIPQERLTLSSFGSTRPINPGDKAQNRRVEVMLRKVTESVPASAPRQD